MKVSKTIKKELLKYTKDKYEYLFPDIEESLDLYFDKIKNNKELDEESLVIKTTPLFFYNLKNIKSIILNKVDELKKEWFKYSKEDIKDIKDVLNNKEIWYFFRNKDYLILVMFEKEKVIEIKNIIFI